MSQPIIGSLLDTDLYKFTMGQIVFQKYRNLNVKYELINRTKPDNLFHHVAVTRLRDELDHVKSLGLRLSETKYLRGIENLNGPLFKHDYIQFLRDLELPDYDIRMVDGQWRLSFSGPWHKAIYWETFALSIVNQLYYEDIMRDYSSLRIGAHFGYGAIQLLNKVEELKRHPEVQFIDFGTRRRQSSAWHKKVIECLREELPPDQFLGTSNVCLAANYDLEPKGTMAHEMFMVLAAAALDGGMKRESQTEILYDWWNFYGYGMSIVLTDTYGSDFFFKHMPKGMAEKMKGLRQDSGDPFKFIDKAEAFYKGHGIDPREKTIVFSDGLDVDTMVCLAAACKNRFMPLFGWGTNLTNDIKEPPVSIVVKVTEVNGQPAVKLSDNIAKATGQPVDVEYYKRIFEYSDSYNTPVVY